MTFLEKARDKLTMHEDDIVCGFCPEDLGLESRSPCGISRPMPCSTEELHECEKCWGREWPG